MFGSIVATHAGLLLPSCTHECGRVCRVGKQRLALIATSGVLGCREGRHPPGLEYVSAPCNMLFCSLLSWAGPVLLDEWRTSLSLPFTLDKM